MTLLERIQARKCGAVIYDRKCDRPKGHAGDHMDATGLVWSERRRFVAKDYTGHAA